MLVQHMSSDYRPRGAGSSSTGGDGGSRRRRGGRGRGRSGPGSGPGSSSRENRPYSNGTTHSAPPKKTGILGKLFGWLAPKTPAEVKPSAPRTDFKERTPRAERIERTERSERPPRADRGERTERAERPPRAERPERPPKAEPVPQEIVSPKLYVGNLAYEAAESDLFDLFSKVGAVKNVEVAMDRHSNRSKGFGFVEMESLETAKEAAEKLNRTDFMGRQIVVSGAKVDRRPTPSNPREEDPTAPDAQAASHDADSTSHEAGSNPDATA
jgi:hypothetical protein